MGHKGKKKHRRRRRGRPPAAQQRALDDRALGGLTLRQLAAEGVIRHGTGRTAPSGGKTQVRALLEQIRALRARLEQRKGMREEWQDAERLAASLEGRLSDGEQQRLREYFAADPEAAGDVHRLADVASLLRRVVDEDLGLPPTAQT